jgi:hypothetical protein
VTGWDDPTSDPIADLRKGFQMIRDERWICKVCATTRWLSPYGPVMTIEELRAGAICRVYPCFDCGATDWLHTMAPVPA